jgi:hypothetical protein
MESKTNIRNQKTQQANIFFKNLKNKIVLVRKYNAYSGQKQVSLIRIAVKLALDENIPLNQVESVINSRYSAFEQRNNAIRDNRQASDDRRRRSQLLTRTIPLIVEQVNTRRDKKDVENQKQQRELELEAIRRNPVIVPAKVKLNIQNRGLNRQIRTANTERMKRPVDLSAQQTYRDLLIQLSKISLVAQQLNKTIHVVVEVVDRETGVIRRTHNYNIPPNKAFNRWWDEKQYKWRYYKDTDDDASVLKGANTSIIYDMPAEPPTVQFYRDGGDTHCVLGHIKKHLDAYKLTERGKTRSTKLTTNYLECISKYDAGVPVDKMSEVCDMFNVLIRVKYPLNKKSITFGTSKRPDKIINLTNTRFNHLEDVGDLINMINDNRITVSRDALIKLKYLLEADDTYFLYQKDNVGISSIITKEAVYETNTEFKKAMKDFESVNHIDEFKLCDVKDKELSAYIKQGTHYNTSFSSAGKPNASYEDDDTQHIDLKNAYAKCDWRDDFIGFLGKITDMRPTDKIEGIGIYTITNVDLSHTSAQFRRLNNLMSAYKSGGTYPSIELTYLISIGAIFDVVFGCWGVKPVEIDFGEDMFNKTPEGSSYYALAVGKYDSHETTSNYYTHSTQDYFNNIANNSENVVRYFGNGELQIEIQKEGNRHCAQFTAFVLSYMRLTMIDQLMEMNLDKVNFVYVDGIYYQPHDFVILDCFRLKPSCWWKHYTHQKRRFDLNKPHRKEDEPIRTDYLSNNESQFGSAISSRFNSHFIKTHKQPMRANFKTELFVGAGGTGKTHTNLIDNGLIRAVYVAVSWKLVAEKSKEYNVAGEVLINLLDDSTHCFESERINKYFNVIIIDEASQIRNIDIKRILSLYPYHKIVVCGDIGYQLEPINPNSDEDGGDIQHSLFENVREFNVNYRSKCEVLNRKNAMLRALIYATDGWNTKLDKEIRTVMLVDANIIKLDEIVGKYCETDSIITGTKEQRQLITDLVKDTVKNKYFIHKRCDKHNVGELLVQQSKPHNGRLEHAHTIHSVQGLTLETKLFIDIRKCVGNMSLRMLYTAVSRARYFKNIYFIVD